MSLIKYVFRLFSGLLSRKGIFLTKSLNYRKRTQLLPPNFDYVRYAALGLCCEEIMQAKTEGQVAELGVFRGDFACRINSLFPGRTLYLFDTFTGFADTDLNIEKKKGLSYSRQDFSATSIESVRARMPYPEACEFKQGYFPETATGLDDKFCFVSIDADLYEPVYQGLVFFYPRMNKGGYIFVHDVNNDQYPGAREALLDFCREKNIAFFPLPDSGGTAVICT